MEWLNYHHLYYFWTVARNGSIAKAADELMLSQPTISAQIKTLEEQLGEALFERVGRRLELTKVGRMAFSYADEIFSLGREMVDSIRQRPTGRPVRVRVGIADSIPKLLAQRLLDSAFQIESDVHLMCYEDQAERLEVQMASFGLDLMISDSPLSPSSKLNAYTHHLGDSKIAFFGSKELDKSVLQQFPTSLDGMSMLLPLATSVRRRLDKWFTDHNIRPKLVAEFADSALMKVFGQSGRGVFPSPLILTEEICWQYEVQMIGIAEDLIESLYAITPERRVSNPAVAAILDNVGELMG